MSISRDSSEELYVGGLESPQISQELKLGISVEANTIPFSLVFLDVDVAAEQADNNILDGCSGELSYVFYKDGQVLQSHGERFLIYRGIVTQPLYGYQDKPPGYVEFSLEERAEISEEIDLLESLVGTAGLVDIADLSNEEKAGISPIPTTGNLIDVTYLSIGKTVPFVFGEMKKAYSSLSTMATRDIQTTPAYMLVQSLPSGGDLYYMLAGHLLGCDTVSIHDNKGNSASASVGAFVNSKTRF